MEFKLSNESDRARLMGHLAGLDLIKPMSVSVKEEDRNDGQNRLLHKLLTQVAEQVEWHGHKFSVTVWKRLCTAAWLREDGHSPMLVPSLDGHGIDMIFEHTSKLSIKQCASLITWIEAYGSHNGVKWSTQDHWQGRY
jgi:hypothetical protein